jgi:hypothetical protein
MRRLGGIFRRRNEPSPSDQPDLAIVSFERLDSDDSFSLVRVNATRRRAAGHGVVTLLAPEGARTHRLIPIKVERDRDQHVSAEFLLPQFLLDARLALDVGGVQADLPALSTSAPSDARATTMTSAYLALHEQMSQHEHHPPDSVDDQPAPLRPGVGLETNGAKADPAGGPRRTLGDVDFDTLAEIYDLAAGVSAVRAGGDTSARAERWQNAARAAVEEALTRGEVTRRGRLGKRRRRFVRTRDRRKARLRKQLMDACMAHAARQGEQRGQSDSAK